MAHFNSQLSNLHGVLFDKLSLNEGILFAALSGQIVIPGSRNFW